MAGPRSPLPATILASPHCPLWCYGILLKCILARFYANGQECSYIHAKKYRSRAPLARPQACLGDRSECRMATLLPHFAYPQRSGGSVPETGIGYVP